MQPSERADARAIGFLAREVWAQLRPAQQSALRRARAQHGGFVLEHRTHERTVEALRERGLVIDGARDLEPLGVLVRAEGLGVTAEQAKRRYGRRKHAG